MDLTGATFLMAIGLWLVAEGLVVALMPGKIEELLDLVRRLPVESRRNLGLVAVAAGVILIWLAMRGAA